MRLPRACSAKLSKCSSTQGYWACRQLTASQTKNTTVDRCCNACVMQAGSM